MCTRSGADDFRGTRRFTISRRLGAGGMGVVYAAVDGETSARVALKTLRLPSPDALLRLKREFRALQDLQHPNLVSLGELFEDAGTWFFTMELVEGVPFLEWVRPGGQLDEQRLRATLAQLVDGLAAIHDAGKVHRDVKPSNILITADGRLVLLDFGLVADLGRPERLSGDQIIGTVAYMAPEQALDRPVGPEADWYGVGALLYEALAGALPYSGPDLMVLMDKQRRPPERPSARAPGVPADLDALCMELMHFDPARRPARASIQASLRGGGPVTPRTTSQYSIAPVFVGREPELAQLADAYRRTRAGTPVSVLVEGESGIGKTTLLRTFVARSERSAVVLAGRCYERESVPYKAVDGVVDALAHHLQKLPEEEAAALVPRRASLLLQVFPVLRRVDVLAEAPRMDLVDPQEHRLRMFEALRGLLGALARRDPLIITIDDLQWADADSLALLGDLLRPPDAPPLLLVASMRPAARPDQPPVALPGEVVRVPLSRLGPAETRALAARALDAAGGADRGVDVDAIVRETDGHPLFVDELVRFAVLRGSAALPHLDDALSARVADLDPPTRHVLELISTATSPIDQAIAARAAGLELADFSRHAMVLRVANLARTGGARISDRIEPYHDRVRQAVLGRLPAEQRKRRHLELARALESADHADREALFVHFQGAGEPTRAASFAAEAAAQAAQALAFERAARLGRTALELMAPDHPDARTVRIRLGDALANAGRGAEAAEQYLLAVAGASDAEALDLQRRAAQQYLVMGHINEALAALRTVLASQGLSYPATPRRALLSVISQRAALRLRGMNYKRRDASNLSPRDLARIDVCWHIGLGMSIVDTVRGHSFQVRGLRLALKAGEPHRIARALAIEGGYHALAGGAATRSQTLFERADAEARGLGDPHPLALLTGCRGVANLLLGRFRESLAYCDEADQMLTERCSGVPWELATVRFFASRALMHLGELRQLLVRSPRVMLELRERGDLYGLTNLRAVVAPFLDLCRDDVDAARAESISSLRDWQPRDFQIQHYYELLGQANVDIYAGTAAASLQRMRERWASLKRSMLLRVQFVHLGALDLRGRSALRAAADAPDGSQRTELLAEASRCARKMAGEHMPWSDPLAQVLAAGVAALQGRDLEADRLYAQAAAGFDATDQALHAAAVRRAHGLLLGGDRGREQVAAADRWMTEQNVGAPARMAGLLAPGQRAVW